MAIISFSRFCAELKLPVRMSQAMDSVHSFACLRCGWSELCFEFMITSQNLCNKICCQFFLLISLTFFIPQRTFIPRQSQHLHHDKFWSGHETLQSHLSPPQLWASNDLFLCSCCARCFANSKEKDSRFAFWLFAIYKYLSQNVPLPTLFAISFSIHPHLFPRFALQCGSFLSLFSHCCVGPRSLGGKVAIVTGASSGIGEAVARALAENGAKVVLAARRKERWDVYEEGVFTWISCFLSICFGLDHRVTKNFWILSIGWIISEMKLQRWEMWQFLWQQMLSIDKRYTIVLCFMLAQCKAYSASLMLRHLIKRDFLSSLDFCLFGNLVLF